MALRIGIDYVSVTLGVNASRVHKGSYANRSIAQAMLLSSFELTVQQYSRIVVRTDVIGESSEQHPYALT
jgi:hypothetical protein